jgi:hypothetical protein
MPADFKVAPAPVPVSWVLAALDEGEEAAAAWLDSQQPGLGTESRQVLAIESLQLEAKLSCNLLGDSLCS